MEHGLRSTLPVRAHRQWTPLARALTAVGDHWTLLIVLALSHDKLRLNALRTRLPGISSGVLDHHLSQMIGAGLLSRERFREMPPRVEVVLTDSGRELLPIAASLARWGMRHEWPAPDRLEHVRADAILRQLPALLEKARRLPDGIVEAVVSDDDVQGAGRRGECASHWFEISEGRRRRLTSRPRRRRLECRETRPHGSPHLDPAVTAPACASPAGARSSSACSNRCLATIVCRPFVCAGADCAHGSRARQLRRQPA